MMIFEYDRYMRCTLSTWRCDQQSYFDRIWSEVSNNVALVNGSEPEPLDCQAEYVNGTDQKIKTGIGVSKKSYRNQPEQPRILGEIQDKGSISSFWALIGSVFLLVHSSIYQGLKLLGVNGEVCIEKNNYYMQMMWILGEAILEQEMKLQQLS